MPRKGRVLPFPGGRAHLSNEPAGRHSASTNAVAAQDAEVQKFLWLRHASPLRAAVVAQLIDEIIEDCRAS